MSPPSTGSKSDQEGIQQESGSTIIVYLAYYSIPKIEGSSFSETSANFTGLHGVTSDEHALSKVAAVRNRTGFLKAGSEGELKQLKCGGT